MCRTGVPPSLFGEVIKRVYRMKRFVQEHANPTIDAILSVSVLGTLGLWHAQETSGSKVVGSAHL